MTDRASVRDRVPGPWPPSADDSPKATTTDRVPPLAAAVAHLQAGIDDLRITADSLIARLAPILVDVVDADILPEETSRPARSNAVRTIEERLDEVRAIDLRLTKTIDHLDV